MINPVIGLLRLGAMPQAPIMCAAFEIAVDEDELDYLFLPCVGMTHICGPMHYKIPLM